MKRAHWLIGLWCLLGLVAAGWAADKPVLMMGTSYSTYERQVLRRDILEPNEITFEDGGQYTSAEVWKNYSLVIITHGVPALNEREIGWIQDYVKSGGRLLLSGPVLSSLRELKGPARDWVGAEGYRVIRGGDFTVTPEGRSLIPDAKAAADIFGHYTNYSPRKLTTAKPLLLRGGAPVLYRNQYGKGEVWYAGLEYFRIINTEKLAEKKIAVSAAARDFLQRLILQGGVQKKSQRIAAGLKAFGADRPVVWRRDFSHVRGAAFADPPFPQAGEALKEIKLDLGMEEWESTPLYLSSGQADSQFSAIVEDLLPVDAQPAASRREAKISASNMRLRVQGVAAPQLTVGPYWLLDLPRQDSAGQSAFSVPLKANESITLWLTLNTQNVAPGTYRGRVRFSNAAVPPVKLEVRVWPVRLPGREYFQTEATYNWSSLLLPSSFRKQPPGKPLAGIGHFESHVANLAAHHIDFNEDGSWIDPWGRSRSLRHVRLRDSGVYFEEALKKGLIKENALPALDFSYFDPFVEKPLLAGMAYFHLNFKNQPNTWLGYAREITGDKELAADSPRHIAIKKWLLGQCVSYLRSRGITHIICFIADEIGPDEIPDVLRRAKLMHEMGIRIEFTATGRVGQSRQAIAELNPAIDRWIWNTVILSQAKAILRSDSPIDPTDRQFTYVADWHRAPYVFNRTRGAFCAYYQLDGLFIHGYLRWYPNGGAIFDTPAGPIDTEGWEGARDGIEDARYWKRAEFLLKKAETRPEFAAEAKKIRQQMAQWVAPSANALVQLKDASYYIYRYQSPESSYGRLQTLKRQLLESLVWLQDHVPTTRTLAYDGMKLVEGGQAHARLVGNAAAGEALNRVLAGRGLGQLSSDALPGPAIQVALGTRAELEPLLGATLLKEATPKAGSYCIVRGDRTIAVVGGDEAGTALGAAILGQLIEVSEQ